MPGKVSGVGPKDACLAIVGESPGWSEFHAGVPFIGKAGKELDRWLEAAGIVRSRCFITNAVKVVPPSTDKEEFFFSRGVPTQAFMEGIIDLHRELSELPNLNCIVAVGNYALWALTQKNGINKWRGSILLSTLIKGVKVVPILHPAGILRGQFHKRPLCEWDLKRAARESSYHEYIEPKANFVTEPTYEDVEAAVRYFTTVADHVTYDTEWFSPNDLAYIGFTDRTDWAIVIPNTHVWCRRAYKEILESEKPKWAQNSSFDVVALARQGINVRNTRHDTMVAFNACWGDLRQKDLGTIASVYTRWPYYKDEVKFIGRNEKRGREYCGKDCVVTDEAMRVILDEEFPYTQTQPGYEISMSIFDIFARASIKGIKVDIDCFNRLRKERLEKAEELEDRLSKMIGRRVNVRSSPQIIKLVYDELGAKSERRSSKQEYLMDIAASTDDIELKAILTAIIRIRQNLNEVSRYLKPDEVLDLDNRLRTNWNVAGTRNGRLSTTKPWWPGIALQTMPDDVREICIPDDGYVFIKWDLEQAEAFVVAALTRDYELLQDLEDRVDIHTKLAAMLPFGLSLAELEEMIRKKGKDSVRQRFLAKKARHSLNYGGTWITLKKSINREYLETGIGITASESRAIVNAYFDIHHALKYWHQQVKKALYNRGYIENAFGRRRQFIGNLSDDHLIRDAIAFEPQSDVADLTSTSIKRMDERFPSSMDATIFAHMHDGGLLQVREEAAEEAAAIVKEETTRSIRINGIDLTIPSEVKIGYNWKVMEKWQPTRSAT